MILKPELFIENAGSISEKKVLLRVDYNVPTDESGQIVTDDSRIKMSIPTIKYLLSKNCKIIIISHKGRPKGKRTDKETLSIVKPILENLLNSLNISYNSINFVDDCIGDKVKSAIEKMQPKDILICENLRFYKEEEENNLEFAKKLTENADIFVSDAFGAVHRAHASVEAIAKFLPHYYGFLIRDEVQNLNYVLHKQNPPLVAIVGGSKVSSKIDVLLQLIKKADIILIGGAMAYTFLRANGLEVGKSLVETEYVQTAYSIMSEAAKAKVQFILPVDHIMAYEAKENSKKFKSKGPDIDVDKMGVDIGPKTIKLFAQHISKGKTIFWNGPLGIFEIPQFAKGTIKVAQIIGKTKSFKVVGGGDSVAAIAMAKLESKFNHLSSGGGASLEYVEGKKLPGLAIFE
ncbi:MAG: phosphoglycerate kinase [Spirochaetales bacterium]|jgi:phosphoglycerate kinase|nr:phosphoglycerate kinase [Exilispira sp.]NMC68314.1 phosphoglycerate kinase [Spirochaetales bacterium]